MDWWFINGHRPIQSGNEASREKLGESLPGTCADRRLISQGGAYQPRKNNKTSISLRLRNKVLFISDLSSWLTYLESPSVGLRSCRQQVPSSSHTTAVIKAFSLWGDFSWLGQKRTPKNTACERGPVGFGWIGPYSQPRVRTSHHSHGFIHAGGRGLAPFSNHWQHGQRWTIFYSATWSSVFLGEITGFSRTTWEQWFCQGRIIKP